MMSSPITVSIDVDKIPQISLDQFHAQTGQALVSNSTPRCSLLSPKSCTIPKFSYVELNESVDEDADLTFTADNIAGVAVPSETAAFNTPFLNNMSEADILALISSIPKLTE